MCMLTHTHIFTHTLTCTLTHTHICTHMCTHHTHMHTLTCSHTHSYFTHSCVLTLICTHSHMHALMCPHIHTAKWTQSHIHMHSHAHMNTRTQPHVFMLTHTHTHSGHSYTHTLTYTHSHTHKPELCQPVHFLSLRSSMVLGVKPFLASVLTTTELPTFSLDLHHTLYIPYYNMYNNLIHSFLCIFLQTVNSLRRTLLASQTITNPA